MLLNIDDLNIGDRQKFSVVTRILTYFIDFMHPNFSQAFNMIPTLTFLIKIAR